VNGLKRFAIILLCLSSLIPGRIQAIPDGKKIFLFPDRNSCLSGDSVWFSVIIPLDEKVSSNILHVQMVTENGRLVSSVMKKMASGIVSGYFPVPDSLPTGVYFLIPFMAPFKPGIRVGTTLFVYNRFDNGINRIPVLPETRKVPFANFAGTIRIETDKPVYRLRDSVHVIITLSGKPDDTRLVASAALSDPFADQSGGFSHFYFENTLPEAFREVEETDGFFVFGKVRKKADGHPAPALVFLSVPGENPYSDYFITGKSGDFGFFLKDAFGTGNIIIQVVSADKDDFSVGLNRNLSVKADSVKLAVNFLSTEETGNIDDQVQSYYFQKLFNTVAKPETDSPDMSLRYSIPFFGKADNGVKPSDYVDLSDFEEVSRELLPGVRFRIKEGEPVIRMVNNQQEVLFDDEPLRLINGIPVFDNRLLTGLKPSDIESIQWILKERMFGDLVFKGVLSIKLKSDDFSWLERTQNTTLFRIACLQPDKTLFRTTETNVLPVNTPDMRLKYFMRPLFPGTENRFSFRTSDISGEIVITVRGVNSDNQPFIVEKKIRVE